MVLKDKIQLYELKNGLPQMLRVDSKDYLRVQILREAVEKIKAFLANYYKKDGWPLFKFMVIYKKYNITMVKLFATEFKDCARLDFIAVETFIKINSGKIKLPETGVVKFGESLFKLKKVQDGDGNEGGRQLAPLSAFNSERGEITSNDYLKVKRSLGFKSIEKEIKINLGYEVNIEMVYIEPGKFIMGDHNGNNASPRRQVTISKGFYIGKYPVTQEQWVEVMKKNPSKFNGKGLMHPIENVSWDDCQKFIEALNKLKKYNGIFRLPTEAEWEYACRAGSDTQYYWGDECDGKYCWYRENSDCSTQPVGKKRPNDLGLFDMSGNVWEWCQDWYDDNYYKLNDRLDPKGAVKGSNRVVRGGSWRYGSDYCRSAFRDYFDPSYRNSYVGFRLALSPG